MGAVRSARAADLKASPGAEYASSKVAALALPNVASRIAAVEGYALAGGTELALPT